MKKVLALMLALVLVLSLAACGGSISGGSGEETTTEPATLKVGDTAEGKICDVTIESVEYVDKIPEGFKYSKSFNLPAGNRVFDFSEDVTADIGYSIVRISYSFEYKSKNRGELSFGFVLDYDGYTFDDFEDHANPKKNNPLYISPSYAVDKSSFDVQDPISYKGDKGEKYIIISDEVKKNTDKPYVLKVDVSLSGDNSQNENFIFDLR